MISYDVLKSSDDTVEEKNLRHGRTTKLSGLHKRYVRRKMKSSSSNSKTTNAILGVATFLAAILMAGQFVSKEKTPFRVDIVMTTYSEPIRFMGVSNDWVRPDEP